MAILAAPTNKTLGLVIKLARRSRGLTQKQLADVTRISQSRISAVESNGTGLTFDNIRKLAAALKTNVSDLIRAAEAMEKAKPPIRQLLDATDQLTGLLDVEETINALFDQAQ